MATLIPRGGGVTEHKKSKCTIHYCILDYTLYTLYLTYKYLCLYVSSESPRPCLEHKAKKGATTDNLHFILFPLSQKKRPICVTI